MLTAKGLAKSALRALAPSAALSIGAARARAHSQRIAHGWGLPAIGRAIMDRYGRSVLSGPFQGLALTDDATREHFAPYLLGTYESELHPALESVLCARRHAVVLDIGCSIGYYAVGLAMRLSTTPVIAFDTDWWARGAVRAMAHANEVSDRLTVHGACSPAWLQTCLAGHALIVSDCEGYEATLFAAPAGALATATLLIETHGTEDAIRDRLHQTHRITTIPSIPGPKATTVDLSFLPTDDAIRATVEPRDPQQSWLVCEPS